MLVESFMWETVVPVNHVHDNRSPGNDVAVLCLFIETDKATDDIGAKTISISISFKKKVNGGETEAAVTYGINASSVSTRLL